MFEAGAGIAIAAGLSAALTALARPFARRLGYLDQPNHERKHHARAIPLLGGAALILSFFATALFLSACGLAVSPGLLVSAGLLCAVGLWDDRCGMGAGPKLSLQILAVFPYVCWGAAALGGTFLGVPLFSPVLVVPLATLWLVSCTNVINLLDGLDGLASVAVLVIVGTLGALAWSSGQLALAALCGALGGAVAGFLIHNWPPARIFLGDAGSLPLGFLAGALSLEICRNAEPGLTLVTPLVLFTIPLFDTSIAILRRLLRGANIGHGDRAHIHHRLRDRGHSPLEALLSLGGLMLVASLAVVAGRLLHSEAVALLLAAGLCLSLVVTRVFGFEEIRGLGEKTHAAWSMASEGLRPVARQVAAALTAFVDNLEPPLAQHTLAGAGGNHPDQPADARHHDTSQIAIHLRESQGLSMPYWEIHHPLPSAAQGHALVVVQGDVAHARREAVVSEITVVCEALTEHNRVARREEPTSVPKAAAKATKPVTERAESSRLVSR